MGRTIYPIEISSKTAASGIWSFNSLPIHAGVLSQVFLMAASSDTTFDFQLIDDKSLIIYDTERREKTATMWLDDEVHIPLRGIYTLRVYNSSADEAFNGRLMIED